MTVAATLKPSSMFPFNPGDRVQRDGFSVQVAEVKCEAMVEYVESDGRLWSTGEVRQFVNGYRWMFRCVGERDFRPCYGWLKAGE